METAFAFSMDGLLGAGMGCTSDFGKGLDKEGIGEEDLVEEDLVEEFALLWQCSVLTFEWRGGGTGTP